MKKTQILLVSASAFLAITSAWSSTGSGETPLSEQLHSLDLPSNQAPVSLTDERLYAVQTRYSSLSSRPEITLLGANDFSGDGFMTIRDAGLGFRFHLSDRWDLGVQASRTYNSLNSSGQRLLAEQGLLPDAASARARAGAAATYHLFYGKFRLGMDQSLYFDQYVSLGAGQVWQELGKSPAGIADAGFVFWVGRKASIRLGMQDWYYKERRRMSTSNAHNFLGHLDIGYLFGGGES
jgi:outer membrane beta-barrel protein